MRIALIGDIHLYRLRVMPWQLLGKRLLGQVNLWMNRRYRFDGALLPPTLDRVASIEPEMILCSGDFTTTSLAGEFEDAAGALLPLAERFPMIAAPGNHDVYTFTSARRKAFAKAMGKVAPALPHFQKLTERWHLLALNSAVPRAISSRGRVGREQLKKAAGLIGGLTDADGLVVLCHYPTRIHPDYLDYTRWGHRLADADGVETMLSHCPARIVYLHGHVHHPWHWPRSERFTQINAGAPCLCTSKQPLGQGFWEIDLPAEPMQTLGLVHHERQRVASDTSSAGQWATIRVC